MDPIESEGRSVTEAIEAALAKSGLRRDQVEVDVLQEGSSGFMGLGSKPARVRLTIKRWGEPSSGHAQPPAPSRSVPPPPRRAEPSRRPRPESARPARRAEEPAPRRAAPARAPRPESAPLSPAEAAQACAQAEAVAAELLRLAGVAAPTLSVSWDSGFERVKVIVESQDASLLVGRDGRVLEALQLISTLILGRQRGAPLAVQVDALSYWEKREQAVLDAARSGADSVRATGKPFRLEPMEAAMRRMIHRSLAADPDVVTASEGEGTWRKIVIRPRRGTGA